jgi:hypothetical protein
MGKYFCFIVTNLFKLVFPQFEIVVKQYESFAFWAKWESRVGKGEFHP